ncbi:aminoglycoside 6-adenylyltransferase [Nonomuraea africana]|uniref:Nucleotidyltransferase domain-containing protein n=1 Tax=Nonomuraea africana TaxID=46171 RepID=A0ABR9KA63_9ACTN|nr:aminoglycoside 6-adenylyltransferase [Nonomuraea africana]MBE1558901.1 hypothetical protein [Nonomuraea africana]
MFTEDRRRHVRALLLDRARADQRVTGAALTGSAARDAEDRWSDVDLFLGVTSVEEVLRDWTAFVYGELGALHHFDLRSGTATYRAFLLADLLEVGPWPGHRLRQGRGPAASRGHRRPRRDAGARPRSGRAQARPARGHPRPARRGP